MISRFKHAIVVLFLLCNFSHAFAAPPEVTRFTLSNGIKVVNLYVENSQFMGICSYLPLGLAADGKAKTQWSHLIEHLTIRTTGSVDFKTSNAETMADNMRLDFIGNTENWTDGLKLHAQWLSGLPFSAESLAEELPKALSEINVTEKRLATHKFAFAAWNQVFRHGETTISMRGDVQSAQLHELQEYRDQHLIQEDRVLMCVTGGVKAETVQSAMEKQLGSIKLTEKTLPPATSTADTAKDQVVPWDINVTHYIESYAIPNVEHKDYPVLYMASLLLRIACMQDAQLKELTGFSISGVELITPEQRYLYISASLKPDSDIEKVKERISALINQLKQPEHNAMVPMYALNFSMQLGSPPDLAILMQQKPIGITEDMMLGNIGLQWGMFEYQYGDALPKLAKDLAKVSADDVADVVNRYLTKDKQMTLLLKSPALK